MKDSKTIISHLKKHPFLQNLEQQECYEILIALLPKNFAHSIKFLYTRHDTLFFVLKHPSAKMEFNYKRNLIKDLLKTLVNFHPKCACIHLEQIKAFVTNKIEEEQLVNQSALFYPERSIGKFANDAKDEKLFALFEEIKKVIQDNQERNQNKLQDA